MPHKPFALLCQMIRQDPIAGARAAQEEYRSHRGREYDIAASAYAVAEALWCDRTALERFYQLPEMKGAYKPNEQKLLLHCHQFVRQARTGPEAERAGAHARAMEGAFSCRWSAEQVLEALNAQGGFSGLQRLFDNGQPTVELLELENGAVSDEAGPLWTGASEPQPEAGGGGGRQTGDQDTAESPAPRRPVKPADGGRSKNKMLEDLLMVEMVNPKEAHVLFDLGFGQKRMLEVTRWEDASDGFVVLKGQLIPAPQPRPRAPDANADSVHVQHPSSRHADPFAGLINDPRQTF